MEVEIKDVVSLAVGTAVGLIAGVAIYWLPLGQFTNEWLAIWNLTRKRYNRDDELVVRAGTDLKPLNPNLQAATVVQNTTMKIWNDEGVGWHHTHSGWKRARVLHVFDPSREGIQDVYKVCHLDIV